MGWVEDAPAVRDWLLDVEWWAACRADVAELLARARGAKRRRAESEAELLASLDVIDGVLARLTGEGSRRSH